jgi:hypothetical protein
MTAGRTHSRKGDASTKGAGRKPKEPRVGAWTVARPKSPANTKLGQLTQEQTERLERANLLLADNQGLETQLLQNARLRLPELKQLLAEAEDHWKMEDGVYRFYHQSFKVYGCLQGMTAHIHNTLQSLLPGRPLHPWFLRIVGEGTGKVFDLSHNRDWLRHTRPIIEAFFHAWYFLRMVCQYADKFDAPPQMLPSGWAAVLALYNLR